MTGKDRLLDAYSSGFLSTIESDRAGCSGLDDMDISDYENSSDTRKKWKKLSSALADGFSVPSHVVPLSKLPFAEKNIWLLKLRVELDKVRTLQKRLDLHRAHAVTMSSSRDVPSRRNVQAGLLANVRKSLGPEKRIDPQGQRANHCNLGATEKFESANEFSVKGTFSLVLRKQCENLLKKLMSHRHGRMFNKPVDIVEFNIPDYYNVIKNPMDLGTIKEKLGSGKYSSPLNFCADVRLTFSNAMTYNPPGNDVHVMADILGKYFEQRWKPIEKKLQVNDYKQEKVHEEIDLAKPMPPSKKRKITTLQQNSVPEPVMLAMTNEQKHNLSRELEDHLDNLPDNIIDFLREHVSNGNEAGEDEIEVDIDDLNNDALFKIRKMLDDHVQEKKNHTEAEPCVVELLNESGLSNSTMQLCKGNDLADMDVEMCGNELPVSSYHRIEIEKETDNRSDILSTLGASSDPDCSNTSEKEVNDVFSPLNVSKQIIVSGPHSAEKAGINHSDIQSISGLDQVEQISQHKPNSFESDCQKDDGDSVQNERQVSTEKLHRATLLINRFADTILKARQKTLNQGENGDFEKLCRAKDTIENQKRKEKARLQADAKAAEDARRRAEVETAAEAKRQRDIEREAARQALLKMEKTVEIDEASRFLEDLKILRTVNPEQLQSSVDETSPYHESQDGLGSFKFGASNPLEQLGLYMKRDEHDDDEDGEVETEPVGGVPDVEEGKIN